MSAEHGFGGAYYPEQPLEVGHESCSAEDLDEAQIVGIQIALRQTCLGEMLRPEELREIVDDLVQNVNEMRADKDTGAIDD